MEKAFNFVKSNSVLWNISIKQVGDHIGTNQVVIFNQGLPELLKDPQLLYDSVKDEAHSSRTCYEVCTGGLDAYLSNLIEHHMKDTPVGLL